MKIDIDNEFLKINKILMNEKISLADKVLYPSSFFR